MALTSNLITDSDKFVEYKYEISEFYIITDGVEEEFPVERITDFRIENFYDKAIFPLFKITAVFEPVRYFDLIKNKDKTSFKIRIQKFYNTEGGQDASLYTDVINDTFVWFPDDARQNYERDLRVEEGDRAEDDLNALDKLTNNVEMFLFKDYVSVMRSTHNYIFKNVNVATIVGYLLGLAKIKHLLISPFDNTTVYPELPLPSLSMDKALMYLNNNYGFYKKGGLIFFSLLRGYILKYEGDSGAYYKKEWRETVIYVLEKSNPRSSLSGTFLRDGEERYYYSASSDTFKPSNSTISENVISGATTTVVDLKSNTTIKGNSGAVTIGDPNINVVYNATSNKYMTDTILQQQKANANVITLVLEHGNIESFEPNKIVTIIFEDIMYNEAYKGRYRISMALNNFTKNGPVYLCTTTLVLKKVD